MEILPVREVFSGKSGNMAGADGELQTAIVKVSKKRGDKKCYWKEENGPYG